MAAVEQADTTVAREAVRPVAAAMMRLAVALEVLAVGGGVGLGGGRDGVLEAAGIASTVAKETEALAGGEGDGEDVDAEEVEAAGAVLAEAGHAVETLAQASIWVFVAYCVGCSCSL